MGRNRSSYTFCLSCPDVILLFVTGYAQRSGPGSARPGAPDDARHTHLQGLPACYNQGHDPNGQARAI